MEKLPEKIEEKPLLEKRKGLVGLRYQKIAELLSRGVDVKIVAEEVGITPKSLYTILQNKPEVIEEAYRLVKERHKQTDFLIVDLYRDALEKIQEHLHSGDLDAEEKAITKVLSLTKPPKDGEEVRPVVNQFFSGVSQESGKEEKDEETLDEIIIRKRKERGLPND